MSVSSLAPMIKSTAVRSLKWKSPWLILGLTATVIPLVLIWSFLGSHFAGGDGKWSLDLIGVYLRFGQWGDIVIHNPLEGAWNVGLPINVWLNPALVPFSLLPVPSAKIWSGSICYICYATSWYLVLRSVAVSALYSAILSQLAFITLDPFYAIFGWPPNVALQPWILIIMALAFVVASFLLRINDLKARTIISNGVAIAIIVIFGIYLDPIWALVIFVIMAVPLAVVVFEHGLKAATAARCLVLLLALGIVFALGPGRFLLALSATTSRYLETALNSYQQLPEFTSGIFQYAQTKYEYAILILGWVLGVALTRGRARFLPIIAAVAFAAQVVFAAIFLFADIRWIIPLPMYYEMAFTGWYVLGAGVGYSAIVLRIAPWISTYWTERIKCKLAVWRAACVLGSLACLGVVPSYLAYIWANASSLTALAEPWSSDHEQEMIAFLSKRLSLDSDSQFRGSVVLTRDTYRDLLTRDSLQRVFIPTLNEYSETLSEQMFVMVYGLLPRNSTQLPFFFLLTREDWVKPYVKLTTALGVRFVLSPSLLKFSSAVATGVGNLKEIQFPGWPRVPSHDEIPERVLWHVYELPMTNTGNYSPVVLYKLGTAPEMLKKMASPSFDFRKEAVVTEELGEMLVPLKDMKLSFLRGGVRVQGTSEGTSLALLPLQYSHCLRISDAKARLVRADLAMVGVVFKGQLDTEITNDFGMFAPGCRTADVADIREMKIAIGPRIFSSDVNMHPTGIKTAADLLPNFMKVLRQVK